MKKLSTIISLLIILVSNASSQNQLKWETNHFRKSETEPLYTRDSAYHYYNTNNKTRAAQITAVWTPNATELLVDPNANLEVYIRTKSDSSIQFKRGFNSIDSLKILYSYASWYDADYTKLLKQHTYGFYSGTVSFTESVYFYGSTIDSVVYSSGSSSAGPLNKSMTRYFYKNNFNAIDSIIDKYAIGSQPPIKWNFIYNQQNNLIEWKYINPVYVTGNKLYKLFYSGTSNLIDSIQFFSAATSHSKTYVYEYNSNGKWIKSSSVQKGIPGYYPNDISDYKNAVWGSNSFFESGETFYYNPIKGEYTKGGLSSNLFNSGGYILEENFTNSEWNNKLSEQTIYNYNTQGIPNGIDDMHHLSPLQIYPNPAHNSININSKPNISFRIINALGSELYSAKTNDNNTSIDISNYMDGIYILLTENGNVYKFIKE